MSEKQIGTVLSTILGCGKLFHKWEEVLENSHPSYHHDIKEHISMNIYKLGNGGALMSDTCNCPRKTHRLIVEQVNEAVEALRKSDSDDISILEVDFWNHL